MIRIGPSPAAGGTAGEDGYVDLLALDDLPLCAQKSVPVAFQRILLCRTPAGIHAVADRCPHALQPLLGSLIEADVIHCAKHGATFDLHSGKPQNGVTNKPLRIFPVRVRHGRIEVALADPAK